MFHPRALRANRSVPLALQELEKRDVPTFLGNQLFPLDNPWNQVVSGAPIASNSDAIIARIVNRHGGTAPRIQPDFGNPVTQGALYGLPVNIATSATPKYTIFIPSQGYAGESDSVQVPIPDGAVIEGDGPSGPNPSAGRGDSHLIVYDRDANMLYELFCAVRPNETQFPYGGTNNSGGWGAYQVSYWNLTTNDFRRVGDTSADAAGLPIMTGLVRPDEANPPSAGGVGVIDHAIRVTMQQTQNSFVFPASHQASSLSASDLPRMGERFRLKASFTIPSDWSPEAKAIAQAMKTYGLIVADNGSDFFFQGQPSESWDIDAARQVRAIRGSDFEVVDLTPIVTGLNVTTGSTAGGTQVTINGKNFSGAAGRLHVLFGTTEAAYTIVSDTQIVATAPAHSAGTVDVRVQSGEIELNGDNQPVFFGYGTSANTAADDFVFAGTSPLPPATSPPPPATSPPPPPPTVSVGNVQMNEGNATGTATFTVSLSSASTNTVTVNYATQNGTATAGSDYTAVSNTLSFAPGQTSRTVNVTVLGDTTVEANETFNLLLSNASGATIGTGTGVATLVNDDVATSPPPPAASPPASPPPPPAQPAPGASNPAPAPRPRPAPLAALSAGPGFVAVTDQSGGVVFAGLPFGMYPGGVQTGVGDFNADGVNDLVLLAGPGALNGLVAVFSGRDFSLMTYFFTLAFPGGLSLAVGDTNGDGFADVLVGPPGLGLYAAFSGRDHSFLGVANGVFVG